MTSLDSMDHPWVQGAVLYSFAIDQGVHFMNISPKLITLPTDLSHDIWHRASDQFSDRKPLARLMKTLSSP
jgi:hypothetical protein